MSEAGSPETEQHRQTGKTRADYEAEAEALIQAQLLAHPDEGVRAIALVVSPPPEAIARVADRLEREGQSQ